MIIKWSVGVESPRDRQCEEANGQQDRGEYERLGFNWLLGVRDHTF